VWIRDILVRIRILLFSSVADKKQTKNKDFCLLVFEGTFTSVFKDKKSKRSHKKVEMKDFLTFFACLWKEPGPDLHKIMTDPDPGGPITYRSFGSGSATLVDSYLQLFDYKVEIVPAVVRKQPF
jgi:hypothetical protein